MSVEFDDIEIMKRVARRDQQAFRALYQQYGTAIYSLAYRILQNTTMAEEVAQDTFLKVWQHKSEWDPQKGRLKNWLLTIAHFTAIDRLRQEKRQPNLHPESIEDMEEEVPSRSEALWQDGTALKMLILQLPKEQALLIEMAFFKGMTHTEISASTQIPLGTVKTRLRNALQKLREIWLESIKQTSTRP